ncbi:MAG: hypothetical protein ACK5OB_09925 [Pirellula sp.]
MAANTPAQNAQRGPPSNCAMRITNQTAHAPNTHPSNRAPITPHSVGA